MELRLYGRVLKRRLWVVVLLTLIASASSFLLRPQEETSYVASLRFLLSVPSEVRGSSYFSYDGYYSWLSSEYLVDDFAQVVKSQEFAGEVQKELGDNAPDAIAIQGNKSSEKAHRILTLRITAARPEQALAIAQAAIRVIEKKSPEYFAQLQSPGAIVRLIDSPVVALPNSPPRLFLNLSLRIGLGFLAGIALALLLHYLDTTLYAAEEVEHVLQVPVLGEIPPEK